MSRSFGVVICSHNRLDYLKRTLEYFQDSKDVQDRDVQVVLADDKSTDGTIEWALHSGLFSGVFINPKGGSYCLNTIRNGGISMCSSEFVILLDCDCKPVDGFILGHDAVFDRFPKAISVGFTDLYDETGTKILSQDLRRKGLKGESVGGIGWANAYGGNIAFPICLWKAIGGFDEKFDGAWGFEDLDFAYRAHHHGYKCVCHRQTVVRHMRHPIRKDATASERVKGRNIKLFEKKHGIRF